MNLTIAKVAQIIRKKAKAFEQDECADEMEFSLGFLKKLGFRKVLKHSSESGYIYVNKKFGIVVKRPYLCSDAQPPARAIPTKIVEVKDENDSFQDSPVFIQPFADVSLKARKKAHEILENYFFGSSGSPYDERDDAPDDMHVHNVAMYRGKAVVIDW